MSCPIQLYGPCNSALFLAIWRRSSPLVSLVAGLSTVPGPHLPTSPLPALGHSGLWSASMISPSFMSPLAWWSSATWSLLLLAPVAESPSVWLLWTQSLTWLGHTTAQSLEPRTCNSIQQVTISMLPSQHTPRHLAASVSFHSNLLHAYDYIL